MSETPVGSAAEEAARLFAAAEQWARRRVSDLDAEHLATGAPECQVCPLCQAVTALRHVRPDAVRHLLDAAASLVAAVQAAVPTTPPGPAARPPGVQHIDLDPEAAWPPPDREQGPADSDPAGTTDSTTDSTSDRAGAAGATWH